METNNNDDDHANLNVNNNDHLTCDFCFCVKKTETALKYHKRTAHDDTDKMCFLCGITVRGAKALLIHKQVCPQCNKVIKNLTQHLKVCSENRKKEGIDIVMYSCGVGGVAGLSQDC